MKAALAVLAVLLAGVASADGSLPTLRDVRTWIDRTFAGGQTLQRARAVRRLALAERLDGLGVRTKLAEAERLEFRRMFAEMMANLPRDPSFPGVAAERLNVHDFGAKGDGTTDDAPSFARAAAEIRTRGGRPTVLEVPAGTYFFGSTASPVIGKPVHVDLSGLTNCWVRGASPETVKFVFGVYDRTGISLNRSSNTTLSNVDCAYRESPFSQCRLESYDASEDSAVVAWCPGTLRPDDPRFARRKNPQVCGVFDAHGRKDRTEGGSERFFNLKADDLGHGRYRIFFDPRHRKPGQLFAAAPGSYLVIPDRDNALQGANAFQSRHCTFDAVWFRNARSSAITGFGAAYVTLYRCRVLPKDETLVFSANADTCFCVRGAYLSHCDFGRMNDDGANCLGHGTFVKSRMGSREIEVEGVEGRIQPGDVVQLVRSMDGRFLADLTVKTVDGTRLTFAEDLPDGLVTVADGGGMDAAARRAVSLGLGTVKKAADLLYAPTAWGTGFVAVSNRIHDVRGNGINVQASHALVEGNVFENVGCGLKLSGLNNWFEGTPPYDVAVRNNRFVDCGVAIHSVYTDVNARSSVESPIADVETYGNRFERVGRRFHLLNCRHGGATYVTVDPLDEMVIYKRGMTPDDVRKLVARYKDAEVRGLVWRVSQLGLAGYPSERLEKMSDFVGRKLPDLVTARCDETWTHLLDVKAEPFIRTLETMDPLAEVVRACREAGLEIHFFVDLFDEMYSKFLADHPECLVATKDGVKYPGLRDYANETAVREKLDEIAELYKYAPDGLYLSTSCHARHFAFPEPELAFGTLPGAVFTAFLARLKAECRPNGLKLMIGTALGGSLNFCTPHFGSSVKYKVEVEWKRWIDEGIADALLLGDYELLWKIDGIWRSKGVTSLPPGRFPVDLCLPEIVDYAKGRVQLYAFSGWVRSKTCHAQLTQCAETVAKQQLDGMMVHESLILERTQGADQELRQIRRSPPCPPLGLK